MRRKPVEAPARIIDWMEGSPIIRDRGRLRINIDKAIKKDLILNGLSKT